MTLTLAQARTMISSALAFGHTNGLKPLTAIVLDAGGHVTAFEREDGSPNRRFEVAHGKAHGAISLGVNSKRLGEMALERPHFISGASAAIGGALVPVAGGVIARDAAGNAVAAVGVSGDTSDNDEAAAKAGIIAAGFVPSEI